MSQVPQNRAPHQRPLFRAALVTAAGLALGQSGLPAVQLGGLLALALGAWRLSGRSERWVLGLGALALVQAMAPVEGAAPEPPASVRELLPAERLQLEPRIARWQPGGPGGALLWLDHRRARFRAGLPRAGRLAKGPEAWPERALAGPAARLAHDGELVLFLPGTPPLLCAEGTVAGPWTRAGLSGSLRIAPDALVRLAPAPRSLVEGALVPLAGSQGLGLERWRTALVEAAAAIGERAGGRLPRGLLAALAFGAREQLEYATGDRFTRTGTRHLLAISGLHVGLLAGLMLLPMARVLARVLARLVSALGRRPPRDPVSLEWPLFLAGLFLLVPLTGGSPPVLRASIVLGLGLGAPRIGRYGRRTDGLNLFGAALLGELLLGSRSLSSLSLQLSYLATLGLLLGLAPLNRSLAGLLGRAAAWLPGAESWRPSWARAGWTAPLAAGTRVCSLALAASLAAVAATLPLAWQSFGEVSPIGVLLTPLAVPLLAWLLVLGWPLALLAAAATALGLETTAGALAGLGGWLLAPAGGALMGLLDAADQLPGTPISLPPRPALLLWLPLLCLGASLLLGRRGSSAALTRRLRLWLEATAALLAGFILMPWSPAPRGPELVALDVGHGTACLLRTETDAVWVFDAGTRTRVGLWREAVGPQLASWDAGPPSVILTHGDRDHWSALEQLIERRPPALWAGHLEPALAAALDPTTPRLDFERGALELPAGRTRLTLLRGGPLGGNEGSRALLIEAGARRRALLTGDAEDTGLAAMLEGDQLALGGALEVLLLPHHGSDSSRLEDLLEVTEPARIWISESGPSQLAGELERRGRVPETTDRDGPLAWRPRLETPPGAAATPAAESSATHRSRSPSMKVPGTAAPHWAVPPPR